MSQSLHDRIHRALGAQEIENIKTRHAYLHAKSHSFEEWDQLWVYSDDVTWAHSFGRMVGWDEMYYGSVEKYDRGTSWRPAWAGSTLWPPGSLRWPRTASPPGPSS